MMVNVADIHNFWNENLDSGTAFPRQLQKIYSLSSVLSFISVGCKSCHLKVQKTLLLGE